MSGVAGARRSQRTKLPDDNQMQKGQPPVWRAALFGLCPQCGANLNEDPGHAHERPRDPRFDKLSELKFD